MNNEQMGALKHIWRVYSETYVTFNLYNVCLETMQLQKVISIYLRYSLSTCDITRN